MQEPESGRAGLMVATQILSTRPQREKQKNLSQYSNFFSICHHAIASYLGSERPTLLLQRIHYWLQNEHSGYLLKDGTKWTYNGYKEIQEQFSWLSIDQIGESIRYLEKQGWLISARFYELKRDIGFVTTAPHMQEDNQRKWYRINYQKLLDDTGVDLLNSRSGQPPKRSRRANLKLSRLQSGLIHKAIWPYPDSSIYKEFQNTSKELSQEREKSLDLINEQASTIIPDFVNPDEVENCHKKITQDNQHPGEDQFSAAPRNVKRSKPTQSDTLHGFKSQEERQGFYPVLLELGKTKGVRSAVAWSAAIIKSIDNGDPCQYLTEYRSGLLVGACEKQEWEIAPGQPYEQFVTYLKTKNKKTGMTDEEAIAAAHHQLKDINLAKSLWESCKRAIAKYQEDWEKQKRIGVQNAYLPPELLPERHVSLEEVADAMESLQAGCGQLQGLAESTENSVLLPAEPEEAEAELEPTKKLPSEPVTELGSVGESEPEEKPTMAQLQDKLNSPLGAALTRMMVKANPSWGYRIEDDLVLPIVGAPSLEHLQSLLDNKITTQRVQRLINQNPGWGFLINEKNQLWEF